MRLSPVVGRTLELLDESGGLFARNSRAGSYKTGADQYVIEICVFEGTGVLPERTGGVW